MKDIGTYLERIGFRGQPQLDLDTLGQIHRLHLITISYENLDVQLERTLDLDIDRIFRKIVVERGGGAGVMR